MKTKHKNEEQHGKQKCMNSNIFAKFAIRNACKITKLKPKEKKKEQKRERRNQNAIGVSIQANCFCSRKHKIH